MSNQRRVGLLNYWNEKFGFLRQAVQDYRGVWVAVGDRDSDTFVHVSEVNRAAIAVKQGDVLEYAIGIDRKTGKPCAVDIQRADDAVAA